MEGSSLTFGDRLRAEREKRAIELREIAAATKIRTSYLEALERNAFSELPGMVFNRGFVRAYAEFLGADAEPLLRAYARELRVRGTPDPTAVDDPLDELRRAIDKSCAARSRATPIRLLTGALFLGMVALAGVGGTWLLRSKSAAPPTEEPQVARMVPPPPPPAALPSATPMPAPQPLQLPPSEEPEVRIQAAPAALAATRLVIDEFGVGKSVVQRALVGRSDRLLAGTDAVFWTLVLGGRQGDRIYHVWIHEGRVVRTLELPVDGSRWRTYSRQPLAPDAVGRWAVEARDRSGVVLARTEFECAGRI
jgi:transcriptional regulator with XRE-family HTH domain